MGVLFNVFVGLAVVNTALLLVAFAAWYYSLQHYTEYMSERALTLMRYVLPPFMLLLGSPVADLVLWATMNYPFPTIGFPGTVLGMVGAAGTLGYVVVDMRESVSLDPLRTA